MSRVTLSVVEAARVSRSGVVSTRPRRDVPTIAETI